jgi:ferredoxin
MAHLTSRGAYGRLVERLNRFPQGAPPSERLFKILELLFTEQEAALVACLPIKPFTAEVASRAWKRPLAETTGHLERLAAKGILLDTEQRGRTIYVLPPPMAGFFEFSMMRVRSDLDQHLLAELFYEYLNVEEDFVKALFGRGETQLGRVFVNEPAVPPEHSLYVLDYERATRVAETASCIGVGVCYCRHKMSHIGHACDAPQDICLSFNGVAKSLTRHAIARTIDVPECLDLLQKARDLRLVQFGENVQTRVSFICNCCGCCCEALLAARRFGFLHPVHTTAFVPALDTRACNGCGRCATTCPVEALNVVSAHDPQRRLARMARLEADRCLGCGVCIGVCPTHALTLEPRPEREITPLDSVHRTVIMAIERGTLHDLIFDNRALFSHRAMAAILGVILRLPPIKQTLASRQMKSRYLEGLIRRMGSKGPAFARGATAGRPKVPPSRAAP